MATGFGGTNIKVNATHPGPAQVVHASTGLLPDADMMPRHGQKYTYATRGTPPSDALIDAINKL